jgi:hypothetical protein
MSELAAEPILTESFDSVFSFVPAEGSAYLFADNGETRSRHIQAWIASARSVEFVEITRQGGGSFDSGGKTFGLRRSVDLHAFVASIASTVVYVDITGLVHAVWAPLIKALFRSGKELRATYVEPDAYKRSAAPVEGQIYDLSASIEGIAPLPGFAVLSSRGATDSESLFVPLLGFEGARFKYLIEQVQPSNDNVIPIIGLPGFKTWYVFETYFGNAPALRETNCWKQARFASANCPFSCFYLLKDIATEFPQRALKVAPIGTKPHALGAILFALAGSAPIEIVYDNPIRVTGRTFGTDRLFVYNISAVLGAPPRVQAAIAPE